MVVRVAPEHLASLLSHLAAQGFPARPVDEDRLHVLFPGVPALFAPAVELEEWAARVGVDDAVLVER